jgi:hypothetical protein
MKFVFLAMLGASCVLTGGCNDQALNQAQRKYMQTQQQGLEKYFEDADRQFARETAEWERQVQISKAQNERYDKLLDRWEEQANRMDTLLNQWELILTGLEKRSDNQ